MPSLMQISLVCLASILSVMLLLWVVGTLRRDVSIVDPFWPAGFILAALIACWMNKPVTSRAMLLAVLTTLWGVRLAGFLLWRRRGHGEDRRYQVMRAKHGNQFWWVSLITVFALQGVLLWFVSLPLQVAAGSTAPLGWLDAAGAIVWAVGVAFESIADFQLTRFQADPRNAGKVLATGLWRWTRHPNYFGDFCVWWGLWLISFAGGAWWTIGSPLLMTFLLLKVSGVALLESTIIDRRPEYVAYKARTNAFFPGPRKQHSQLDPS